jgi:hypothetical protein
MRKIHRNKVRILKMTDSTTGESMGTSSWCGKPMRLWISYEDTTKHYTPDEIAEGYETVRTGKIIEVYLLEDSEEYPMPELGFARGLGFWS